MIVVNIQTYGDFDMPYTAAVMISPHDMDKKVGSMIKKEAEEMFSNTNDTSYVIQYLKDWGFTTAKTIDITVGGNL